MNNTERNAVGAAPPTAQAAFANQPLIEAYHNDVVKSSIHKKFRQLIGRDLNDLRCLLGAFQ